MFDYLFEMPDETTPARPPEQGTVSVAELLRFAKASVYHGPAIRLREFGSGIEGWLAGSVALSGAWDSLTVLKLDSGRLAAYLPNQLQKIDEKPI